MKRVREAEGPLIKSRGVILQASYRIVTQPGGRRVPVVHLYGRLEDGRTFLVRDDRQQPHFYVLSAARARAWSAGGNEPKPTAKRDFSGSPVSQVVVGIPSDVPAV